ncbi:MAG: hypothetical protein H6981_09230 [Gammaproteobacteria bacterium]|nr:hypothetical protein [Gammaproteobacteria bacterium]MCP5136970.1 hypothetical protein [Gammaproteobacteria bacterium]
MRTFSFKTLVAAMMATTVITAVAATETAEPTQALAANPYFVEQQAAVKASIEAARARMEEQKAAIESQMKTLRDAYGIPEPVLAENVNNIETAKAAFAEAREKAMLQYARLVDQQHAQLKAIAPWLPDLPKMEQPSGFDQDTMKTWFDAQVAQAEARAEAARTAMGVWMPEAPKAPDFAAMKDMDRDQVRKLMEEQFDAAKARAEAAQKAMSAYMPKMPEVPSAMQAPDFAAMKDMDRDQIRKLMEEKFEAAKAQAEAQRKAFEAGMPKMPAMPQVAGYEAPEMIDFKGMTTDEAKAAIKAQFEAAKARAESMRKAITAMAPAMPQVPGFEAPKAIDFSNMDREQVRKAMEEQFEAAKARSEAARKAIEAMMPKSVNMSGFEAPDFSKVKDMDREQIQAMMKEQFEKAKAQAEALRKAAEASMPKLPTLGILGDISSEETRTAIEARAKAMREQVEQQRELVAKYWQDMADQQRAAMDTQVKAMKEAYQAAMTSKVGS